MTMNREIALAHAIHSAEVEDDVLPLAEKYLAWLENREQTESVDAATPERSAQDAIAAIKLAVDAKQVLLGTNLVALVADGLQALQHEQSFEGVLTGAMRLIDQNIVQIGYHNALMLRGIVSEVRRGE